MRPSLRHINANGTVADRLSCQPERSLCDRTLAPSPFTSNTAASDEPASPMFGGAGWIGEQVNTGSTRSTNVARKFRLFSSGIDAVRAPLSIATCSDSANDRNGLIFPWMLKSPRITTRAARRVQPRSVRARKVEIPGMEKLFLCCTYECSKTPKNAPNRGHHDFVSGSKHRYL